MYCKGIRLDESRYGEERKMSKETTYKFTDEEKEFLKDGLFLLLNSKDFTTIEKIKISDLKRDL